MVSHVMEKKKKEFFVEKIMTWSAQHRRNFIWREKNDDFFTVFISEFFLRKTKSETVDKYLREFFLVKYHSFCDFLNVDISVLKGDLKPLGLHNQRSFALKKIAAILCQRNISTFSEILALPHCGRYIANAVECFFYKRKRPIVDHNIQRVFNRFFSIPVAVEIHKANHLWNFAESLLPDTQYVEYNYSLLDFSSLICKPRSPLCDNCPLISKCDYAREMIMVEEG